MMNDPFDIRAILEDCRRLTRENRANPRQRILATLRDYQMRAVARSMSLPNRLLIEAPCGSGKSRTQLGIQSLTPRSWILSPSIEIINGYTRDLGKPGASPKEALGMRITTPTKLRNMLLRGDLPERPSALIIDEAHRFYEDNSVSGDLERMLGDVPFIGFTATPFRGSLKETEKFREYWGEPFQMLSLADAIFRGYVLAPKCLIRPLVDDALLSIKNGEIDPGESFDAYQSQYDRILGIVLEAWGYGPTAIAVSNSQMALDLSFRINEALNIRAIPILQDTPRKDRDEAFQLCARKEAILVQVRVLTTGVDIPEWANLIDCMPTQSPCLFLQLYGRVCRKDPRSPGKVARVFCTNRNLERHGWLYEGTPTFRDYVAGANPFPDRPNRRLIGAVTGFETLSKARVFCAPLSGNRGYVSFVFLVSPREEGSPIQYEYLVVMSQARRVRMCRRMVGANLDWKDPRCKWEEIDRISVDGFSTGKKRGQTWTDKQAGAWRFRARSVGLDPEMPESDRDPRMLELLFASLENGWKF